jgi:hypothetical protein
MSNAFAKHGIQHLSASSLNEWINSPLIWSIRYLGKHRDEYAPAAWRGQAVEDGLTAVLRGGDGAGVAAQTFENNALGDLSDEVEAERKRVAPMLAQAVQWSPPAPLIATQLKIEHWFDGVPVPLIGYLDFVFEGPMILDLKTTKACPSSPRRSHTRQMALYRAARANSPASLLYVTEKKFACYPVGDNEAAEALAELRWAAMTMGRFLSVVDSAQDALHMLPLDTDDFRVSDSLKAAHQNLMGA